MSVFGVNWVDAIKQSAQQIADKYSIPDNVFHSLRPYTFEEKYIVWEVSETKRFIQLENGERYLDIFEPDKVMLNMESGKYIYLWAEVHGLATALLTEDLSENSQHILYRELEVKFSRAETNIIRGMKATPKYNKGLQSIVDSIFTEIKSKSYNGKCSESQLINWLAKKAKDGLETFEDDCEFLTFHKGKGEYADIQENEYRVDTLAWTNKEDKLKYISINSLKPYFRRAKKLST